MARRAGSGSNGTGARSLNPTAHMDAPEIKTPLPGPNAKAIIDRDRKYVSPSYTRDYPFVIARGEGAVVEDVDGNRFLDCAAGIAVNSTGVSHPEVVKAIADQAQKFIHMSGTDFYLRAAGASRRGAGLDRADRRRRAHVLRELGHRGDRSGDQAVALSHEASRHHRVSRRLSRPLARVVVADGEQGGAASRLRPVHARVYHAPYPDPYRASSPDAAAAQSLSFIDDQLFTASRLAGRDCRGGGRAHSG